MAIESDKAVDVVNEPNVVVTEASRLSRTVARLLRHEPWSAGLDLDEEGWASVDDLVEDLRARRPDWAQLDRRDLLHMIERSEKRRFEMRGDRIRALYGHSIPGGVKKTPSEPPEVLFHGTARHVAPSILADGLRPMKRQFVHLSIDVPAAELVGRRKSRHVEVLRIKARKARSAGVAFYRGNESIWLVERVPAEFIELLGSADPKLDCG